jgi:ribosome-binding protein aMBF1 (putative translation factor)
MADCYAKRNFSSTAQFRHAVTTPRFVVGNLAAMTKHDRRPARPRRQWRKHFVREWRHFRGMTQDQLAEAVGLTKATVSRIETGDIAYTRDFLEAAADALGTHPGILLMRAPMPADNEATAQQAPDKLR